jgi:S-DNA-T family DNA segregation ATPase FtsK/SpoIIIE
LFVWLLIPSVVTVATTQGRRPTKGRHRAPEKTRPVAAMAALEAHATDVWGLGLIAVGLVAALAIYVDLAGPLGRGIDLGAGAAIGAVRLILPLALVAAGVVLIRDRGDDDESSDENAVSHPARLLVGSLLLLVSTTGLLHLGRGTPAPDDGVRALGRAGGLVGFTIGQPLNALAAPWAASLVLVTIGLVGLVVLTKTSVRVAADKTAAGVRPLTRLFAGLFELDSASESRSTTLYDQDADRSHARDDAHDDVDLRDEPPRTERRRRPKTKLIVPEEDAGPTEQMEIDLGPGAKPSPWKLPPLNVLDKATTHEVDKRAVEERGRVLEAALSQHGVETRLVGMVVGPSVTRYELELAPGVKVARVTSLHKDIAYAMASPDVRILAPIPGRQAIGVEVPNNDRQIVFLGDILASAEAKRAHHPLEVAVGRDINGKAVMMNLATMPHILIAGATGAGKSSCLNSMITSLLMRSTPDQVRMILVDPKRVEMGQYDRLPHLLTQVVTNPKKAANALSWAVREMERRYDLLADVGFRDITGYNAAFDRGELVPEPGSEREYPRLPFILVVIDELSDLMMVAARDVEDSICRIAQMARAVGIHLVIATQRPSVNVITGVIKANIPARLAFAVSSVTDSRVILDQSGAERLIGKGDMLLLGPASGAPNRIQGSWVGEEEVRKVVGQWRRQAPDVRYDAQVQGTEEAGSSGTGSGGGSGDDDDDDLLRQAMELVVRSQLGSTSMLQRKLRVGFARAGRLMDLLEQRGVVGPSTGSKARDVLMTPEELDEALSA